MKKNTSVRVEICAFSFISCLAADRAGANRVELCASPWEGGTTPSAGLVSQVLANTTVEVHAMLRPRGGDFCYDAFEKDTMEAEALSLIESGVHGLVLGALLPNGDIDYVFMERIRSAVGAAIPLTFHRAIDVSKNPLMVMEALISLGFIRILTSGQQDKALDGILNIAKMVDVSNSRIEIMAGSGITPGNCLEFLQIGVDAIHLSARAMKDSQMEYKRPQISMGGIPGISEFEIMYASEDLIRDTVNKVSEFYAS
jgi:copper homeostasis protein